MCQTSEFRLPQAWPHWGVPTLTRCGALHDQVMSSHQWSPLEASPSYCAISFPANKYPHVWCWKVLLKLSLWLLFVFMFGTYIYIWMESQLLSFFFPHPFECFLPGSILFWCMCFECLWWTRQRHFASSRCPVVISSKGFKLRNHGFKRAAVSSDCSFQISCFFSAFLSETVHSTTERGHTKKAKTVNDLQFFEIFGLTLAPTENILLVDYAKLKP